MTLCTQTPATTDPAPPDHPYGWPPRRAADRQPPPLRPLFTVAISLSERGVVGGGFGGGGGWEAPTCVVDAPSSAPSRPQSSPVVIVDDRRCFLEGALSARRRTRPVAPSPSIVGAGVSVGGGGSSAANPSCRMRCSWPETPPHDPSRTQRTSPKCRRRDERPSAPGVWWWWRRVAVWVIVVVVVAAVYGGGGG